MELNEMEKKMLFQAEGDCQAKVLNELYMTVRYSNNSELREAAESLNSRWAVCLIGYSKPYRTGRLPYKERQHPVCGYAHYRQPRVFQEEVAKGDTSVFPEGGRLPHRAGRQGKYRVGRGTHGRENTPPAFGLCPSDRGQPLVCKGDYREQSQPHKMAGRFSRLYGGEISRLGAWGKRQQDRQEAYPHPSVQAGGQSLQTGKSH